MLALFSLKLEAEVLTWKEEEKQEIQNRSAAEELHPALMLLIEQITVNNNTVMTDQPGSDRGAERIKHTERERERVKERERERERERGSVCVCACVYGGR